MTKMPFDYLALPSDRATGKPRTTGLTMMIDMGLPPGFVADSLRVVAPYVDLVKIFVGSARLYDEAVLREKLEIYRDNGIKLFIGGQFVEYIVYTQGTAAVPRFMGEVRRLGIDAIEVSDNCVPLTDEQRRELIRMGVDEGLEVHGEVGSKSEKADPIDLVRQAEVCLGAGCDMVLFEAAELVSEGAVNKAAIEYIHSSIDAGKIMIELPGPWIRHVSLNDVFEMKKYVIGTFGRDANVGNVAPDQVVNLEALRCGIGIAGPGTLANGL